MKMAATMKLKAVTRGQNTIITTTMNTRTRVLT